VNPQPPPDSNGGVSADQIQQAIDDQQTDQGPPPVVQPCAKSLTWIEVKLIDMEGNPVSGLQCRVKTPDGKTLSATLDKSGKVRFDGIRPGTCMIGFPDLDREAWERV
jgi:hypothetical protein